MNKISKLTYRKQKGQGYFPDPSQPPVGNQPVIMGYDDFAPPLFVGELLRGQTGGKRKSRRSLKKKSLKRKGKSIRKH